MTSCTVQAYIVYSVSFFSRFNPQYLIEVISFYTYRFVQLLFYQILQIQFATLSAISELIIRF